MLLVAATCSACGVVDDHPSATSLGIVERIVDGDTIDVRVGSVVERVRLIGIDTPEIAHPGDPTPAECGGDAATAFTALATPVGSEVRLLRDVVPRDDYGRLLAYVERVQDAALLNLLLADAGYADAMTIPPNDRLKGEIGRAVSNARAAGRGMWASC